MRTQIHPTFQKRLQKQFIVVWVTGVLSFAGGLALHRNGYPQMGWVLSAIFAISIFGGLMYWYYQLHNVPCLMCKGKTKTAKDASKSKWVANCQQCQIEWDLQTGVGND